jgi:hypothetical protein
MHEYDLYNIIYNQISKQTRKYQNINGQEICERDWLHSATAWVKSSSNLIPEFNRLTSLTIG